MRPRALPKDFKLWEGATINVIGAPPGLEDYVESVEAVRDKVIFGDEEDKQKFQPTTRLNVLITLDDGELEELKKNGGKFWLTVLGGGLFPFSFEKFEAEPVETPNEENGLSGQRLYEGKAPGEDI